MVLFPVTYWDPTLTAYTTLHGGFPGVEFFAIRKIMLVYQ